MKFGWRRDISKIASIAPALAKSANRTRLLGLEEQNCAVTQVEVDEVLSLCWQSSAHVSLGERIKA